MKNLYTYTLPRPFFGYNIPISIQNTTLRDYAQRNKMQFLLSITEISKRDSFIMLDNLLKKKSLNDLGVVSGFIFPIDNNRYLKNLFGKDKIKNNLKIHLVLESLILTPLQLIEWANDISMKNNIISDYNSFENSLL